MNCKVLYLSGKHPRMFVREYSIRLLKKESFQFIRILFLLKVDDIVAFYIITKKAVQTWVIRIGESTKTNGIYLKLSKNKKKFIKQKF